MTPEEVKLWVRLREWRRSHGYHFRRQAPVDGIVLDFLCKSHKVIGKSMAVGMAKRSALRAS